MENLISWIVIIAVWLVFSYAGKKKPGTTQTPKPKDTSIEDLFRILGMQVPEKPRPQFQQSPVEIREEKPKQQKPVPSLSEQPQQTMPTVQLKQSVLSPKQSYIEDETQDILSLDKIQEGFVYSIILGAPKAYQWINRDK
jgi:hypothetical protein